MLVRTDPFRELDRVASQVFGTVARPAAMPMDAWRHGDTFVIEFDLPAIDPEQVELDVERNMLTVRAERLSPTGPNVELIASERPRGMFSRQVILGDTLDTDNSGRLPLRSAPLEHSRGRKGQATQNRDRRPTRGAAPRGNRRQVRGPPSRERIGGRPGRRHAGLRSGVRASRRGVQREV